MRNATKLIAVPLFLALISSSAMAQNRIVRFSGCVRPGVERGCLVVESGRHVYNITSARPSPRINRGISGYGIRSGGMSYCMQGTILRNVRWRYNRLYCPPRPRR